MAVITSPSRLHTVVMIWRSLQRQTTMTVLARTSLQSDALSFVSKHAIVRLQRKKFGSIGFNFVYPFTTGESKLQFCPFDDTPLYL